MSFGIAPKLLGKQFLCPVLYLEFPYAQTLALGCTSEKYPDPEDHRFSNEAWREYFKAKVKDGGNCIYTKCQREGCNCIVPPSIWKKLLVDQVASQLFSFLGQC